MLSTVTCVNILPAISDFFFFYHTHGTELLKEFLGILHSLFRILSSRVIHWGWEVSKLECWVHCGLVKMIKWPRAAEGGRFPTSALILTHVWVEAVFFPEKGKLKSQHGTVSKAHLSSHRLGFYYPRSDLHFLLQLALSSGNFQKVGRVILMGNLFPHVSKTHRQGDRVRGQRERRDLLDFYHHRWFRWERGLLLERQVICDEKDIQVSF